MTDRKVQSVDLFTAGRPSRTGRAPDATPTTRGGRNGSRPSVTENYGAHDARRARDPTRVSPLRRNDPRTLLRTVVDDPRSVYRYATRSSARVLLERDHEVPPTPSQVREAVEVLFPGVPPGDRLDYWIELRDDRAFRSDIESRLVATDAGPGRLHANWREFLYVFVRHARPSVVFETGVRGGLSTSYLLAALDANGSGRLVSVDIGDESLVPDHVTPREPGWMVPDGLRSRWEPRIGDSEALVADVLAERDVGVFLSDVPNESLGTTWRGRDATSTPAGWSRPASPPTRTRGRRGGSSRPTASSRTRSGIGGVTATTSRPSWSAWSGRATDRRDPWYRDSRKGYLRLGSISVRNGTRYG